MVFSCPRYGLLLLLSLSSLHQTIVEGVQRRTECDDWANMGECDANPNYMWEHCEDSCTKVETKRHSEIAHIGSFFELSAMDIDQNMVDFEEFRGKVTIVVNVASYCGTFKICHLFGNMKHTLLISSIYFILTIQ